MAFWRRLTDRITGRSDQDLYRELRAHLELEAEDQQEAGLPPDEARYAAQRAFGNVTLVKEDLRATWRWTSLEIIGKDLRYALRTLRANPLFTLTAVLSLALGIGANTAIFTLLHVTLWKPLPVKEPHQIFHLMRFKPVANRPPNSAIRTCSSNSSARLRAHPENCSPRRPSA